MKLFSEAKLKNSFRLFSLAGVVSLLATGCQTYKQQNKTAANWQHGNLSGAVADAKTLADKNANNKDAIIWRLEQGAVLRTVGQYADSNQAFDQAQAKIDDYAQKAKVRLVQESGAMLSNQAELDYEGRSYDGIMLNTYKALNYLALGEIDKARPEIIRAYERQQDAVEANKKRIEAAQNAAENSKDKATIEKAQNDGKLKTQLAGATANLDSVKVYADYVNPFTVYLDGIYFLANAADASDLERAHKSFERVVSFAPDNDFVKQDLAIADEVINGKPLAPATYVVFETGCAPVRDQIRIDIPIIVSKVSYVGAAFPTLKLQGNYLPSLTVSTSETNLTTAPVASMDGIVALDFKNELPVVITKTIAATVTKAVAAYTVNQAAHQGGGDWGGLIAQIGTAVYQVAVNIADERTWTTLPKEFQVARFPTPADRKISVSGPGGFPKQDITIEDGAINLVYVKSINTGSPLVVTTMKLNGSPLHLAAGYNHATDSSAKVVTNPLAKLPATPSTSVVTPSASAVTPSASAVTPAAPTAPAAILPVPEAIPTAPTATPVTTPTDNRSTTAPTSPTSTPSINAEPVPSALIQPPSPSPAPTTDLSRKLDSVKIITDPEVSRLCESLKSNDPRIVIESLKALRRMNAPEAVPQILPCLDHYDFHVIRDACRTLAVLGNKDIIPLLQPLLVHNRADVRGDARSAIIKIAHAHRYDPEAAVQPAVPTVENFVKDTPKN